ncbi:MAG: GNAT family N-acetyltransferase [Anaerolineae bacterium]|nr:GNAT family N-acetyltransferase [Anaerolineae bacterium]
MKNFSIQPATEAHQPAIKALIRTVGINPMGLKWQRFLVALDESGTVIGCGQVKPHGDGSRELASIAVVSEWRNQGIARAIIEALIAQHPLPLWLTCMSRLVVFYEQFGFVEVDNRHQMPPYFRRVTKLFPLYARLTSVNGYLAVMMIPAK